MLEMGLGARPDTSMHIYSLKSMETKRALVCTQQVVLPTSYFPTITQFFFFVNAKYIYNVCT